MDDLDGYREARAHDWAAQQSFELDNLMNDVVRFAGGSEQRFRLGMRICGFCSLVMTVLFSIGSLLPLQYGLTVNWVTRQVNLESTYHGGRHFIGPWNNFIVFPSTVVTVTFTNDEGSNGPLATRTKDGLSLTLQLAFQYRMQPENLGALYQLANMQYEPLFVRNARDVLLKAAADYEAREYWQDREKIGDEMVVLLNKRLHSVYAECRGLQLLVISLPSEFEDSIVQTQVQKQMVRTKQNEQSAARIAADTLVWQSQYSRNVTVTKNGADASYSQSLRVAEAEANKRMVDIEASNLRFLQKSLNLTPEQIVAYQQFMAYNQMKNASFIFGLGNAMLTLPAPTLI